MDTSSLIGKKVIVTGGRGYIGGQLIKALEKAQISYLSIDKLNTPSETTASFNLCDEKEVQKSIAAFQPDLFIHCGTHSAIAYRDNFLNSFTEDSIAISNILKHLPQECLFIYFSSSYVCSGLTGKITESTPLSPSHNFGIAKSFFEQFALRIHPNTVIFRLSSVFGPGESQHPNAVLGMAQECMNTNSLTIWGEGKRMMQYVYMSDVITAILKSPKIQPGIYNLGGDEYLSVTEAAKKIAELFSAKVTFLKEKKEGDTLPFMENGKLKKAAALHFTQFTDALNEYLPLLKERKA
jgi:nucleoside-diphosphate-sugar epimerase